MIRPNHRVSTCRNVDAAKHSFHRERLGRRAIERDLPAGIHEVGQDQSPCGESESVWAVTRSDRNSVIFAER